MQHHLAFLDTKDFFVLHQLFIVDMKHFFVQHQHVFSTPNYFLCNVKLFVSTQNYFLCNTKFLFWTSFMMLCHGDIFLWSHSSKNIITCQKINKLSFLCETKKLILFFVHHHFFIFIFYITHCQHVDLLRSGPGNKETLTIFHSLAWYIPKQLRTKSFSRKKVSYYLGLMFVKLLRGSHILVKLQACFSQILQKLIP